MRIEFKKENNHQINSARAFFNSCNKFYDNEKKKKKNEDKMMNVNVSQIYVPHLRCKNIPPLPLLPRKFALKMILFVARSRDSRLETL
jgi:hypothetical protein